MKRRGVWSELFTTPNTVMTTWANAIIQCAFLGNLNYQLTTGYLEYYNCASPGDTVTVPSFARTDSLTYYTGLASPGDYLRVPLSGSPSVTIKTSYTSYFTAPLGNVATISLQSSGTVGVLGRAFAAGNNSKIFGCALVSAPVWSDSTKDTIFARAYFPTGQQQLKVAGSQIGITWSIPLL